MNDTTTLAEKNNREFGATQIKILSRTEETDVQDVENECVQAPVDEKEETKEENIQATFYELNRYLADYPVEYTESELVKKQIEKLCFNFNMKNNNSIVLVGDSGCGKTSLIYLLTERLIKGDILKLMEGYQVLEFSSLNFPVYSTDIINELLIIVQTFVRKGVNKLILFFDNFENYPQQFWQEYTTIMKMVTEYFDDDVSVKFLLTVNTDSIDANEKVTKEVVKSSLVFLTSQEVIPEEIISVLKPRITELMEKHGIEEIEAPAYYMIYSMELANTAQTVLSYEVYLTYLDKIMSEYECKGIHKISLKEVREYYLVREYKGDFFKGTKDKKSVARHEAGHTLLSLLLPDILYLTGVTIIGLSNGGFNGLTMIFANSSTNWQTKSNFKKYLAFYLAGRYSEGVLDKGAISDIEKANMYARDFVLTSGMYKELGKDFFCDTDEYYKLTEETKAIVDNLVRKLLKKSRKYAKKVLKKHKCFVDVLTEKLYNEKYLSRDDVFNIWSEFK